MPVGSTKAVAINTLGLRSGDEEGLPKALGVGDSNVGEGES